MISTGSCFQVIRIELFGLVFFRMGYHMVRKKWWEKKQHRDYLVVSASWLGQHSKINGIVMFFGIGVLVENWRNQDSRYCNTKGWDFSLHPSGKNEGWQEFLKPKTNSHKPKTDCSTYGLGNQLVCRIAVQLKSHNCNIILGKNSFGKKTERTPHLFVDVCPLQTQRTTCIFLHLIFPWHQSNFTLAWLRYNCQPWDYQSSQFPASLETRR